MKEMLILKYLNPSTATAKDHMKCPRQGIRSTRPKVTNHAPTPRVPVPIIDAVPIFAQPHIPDLPYPGPTYGACMGPHVIDDNDDESIVNSSDLGRSQTNTVASSTTTLPGCSHACHSMEACVSLFSTIMSPTPSSLHPLRGWTMSVYSTPRRNTSKS
jgi:hypothetical protein